MNTQNNNQNAGNIVVANFNKPTDVQKEIIDSLRDMMSKGEEINVMELAIHTDLTADMTQVKTFLINGQFCSKSEWDAAVKVAHIKRELGFYPKTVIEFVDAYIKRENISVDYQKRMKAKRLPTYEGQVISSDARMDVAIDTVARIQENIEIRTDTLQRDLRLTVSKLKLKFTTQEIDDATSKWFEQAVADRVQEVMLDIAYTGTPNAKDKVDAWDAVCSQFDLADHNAEFVKAILAKFIWQVKRKIIGLPISNHLMPVILGPQGVGKSTFVTEFLLKPLSELVGSTDFKMIEDNRNTEQWRNYVLFLDEMGYAGKADIDNVKNKITASSVTGRPMRSNDNVQYAQKATFVDCH
ncbi:hypothetical protein Brsp07_05485 [Brucella sp. NBRC 14130]|uniref:VapE domain-containing protein n=1 Tax=Brucella sp. NBRC 14130 TaxID=3075483 RepID=UPI00309528C4